MGGLTTLSLHGAESYAEWGKRGGRPRSQTLEAISLSNKRGKGVPDGKQLNTLSLLKMREIYRERYEGAAL